MRFDRWSVDCVGSAALISFWEVGSAVGFSSARLGRYGGSIIGNDAVIVTRELRDRGLNARCRLLDATDSDIKLVTSILDDDSVTAVGGLRGELTRSLCLEDAAGLRRWIFSRIPEPSGDLGEISASVLYVDYYPEFVEFLNHQLKHLDSNGQQVVVNLSAIATISDLPPLALKPSIVQASIPNNLPLDEAAIFAVKLIEATGAKKAFTTIGARGAVLAIGDKTWHADAPVSSCKGIIGSGAVFSTEMIVGLSSGLDGDELLKWSVSRTALRLQSWRWDESYSP